MKPVTIYAGKTAGANTIDPPDEFRIDPDTGLIYLEACVNMTISDKYRASMRGGRTKHLDGSYYSVWSDGPECFAGKGTSLYQLFFTDGSLTERGIRSGMSGNRISFCRVGPRTYYGDGAYNGVIYGGASYPWPTGTYVGPETMEVFEQAPVGSQLAYFARRIFIAVGNILYRTRPNAFGLVAVKRSFSQFNSNVIMVKAMDNGIFVSDQEFTWWFEGKVPREFDRRKAAPYPAIEGTLLPGYVVGTDLGFDDSEKYAVWASPKGVCIGTQTGQVIQRNRKVNYPASCKQGASFIYGNNFIHTLM